MLPPVTLAAERLDERAFSRSGDAGDTDTDRVARFREDPGKEFLGERFVCRVVAFHQSNGARENADVGGEHALLVVVERELAAFGRLDHLGFRFGRAGS
jgi:hypothetical protein